VSTPPGTHLVDGGATDVVGDGSKRERAQLGDGRGVALLAQPQRSGDKPHILLHTGAVCPNLRVGVCGSLHLIVARDGVEGWGWGWGQHVGVSGGSVDCRQHGGGHVYDMCDRAGCQARHARMRLLPMREPER